jgi:hypothetical protein
VQVRVLSAVAQAAAAARAQARADRADFLNFIALN